MKTWIIRFTTTGIKNIDKLTSVNFYNNSVSKGKTIDLEKKNLKGIFGINGAGKSAYVLAVDIYNSITTKSDYLVQDFNKSLLNELINKATKELFLENVFAVSKEDDFNKVEEVLKHTVVIYSSVNEFNQKVYRISEKLEKLRGNTINSNYEEIYNVNDGKLTVSDKCIDSDLFKDEYSNRLDQSTLSSYLLNSLAKKNTDEELGKGSLLLYLFYTYFNANSTKCFIDNDDIHDGIRFNDIAISNEKISKMFDNYIVTFRINGDIVSRDDFDKYEAQVESLKRFIQILKPNLKDIRVDYRIDGDNYRCNKIFVYDDYEVDEEYESTGIKRIVKMYAYLNLAMKGYKVFIDELDANISGVFLDRLLEFFAENGQGQLCFTSHNIMSMNILKQYKNSITVFGETGKVVNVVKNGHYQPVNLYYEGFVEDSPFNINSFDFYKSFGMEEK